MKYILSVIALSFLFLPFSTAAQSSQDAPERYLINLFDRSFVFDTTKVVTVEAAADSLDAWKKWRTVENFYYGKNRGSLPMIADLEALHPYFRDKVIALIEACASAGITLAVVETYRTPAKQSEYYAMGKKYTSAPGGKSRHQFGLAVDVVPIVDSAAVWNDHRLWRKIGLAGERLGLRWGGRWRVTYDPGHFEWLGGRSRHELAKGLLPRIPPATLSQYQTLEDDLKQLQENWRAWEVEQSVMANKEVLGSQTLEAGAAAQRQSNQY